MNKTLLEINNLSVNVGKFSLKNIEFSMESNDYVVILGPTGCGKTVLLESIAGLKGITSGSIFLNGKEITHLPPEARHLGFAYQDSLLYPFMTVQDNILFGAKARGSAGLPETSRRLERLAETMGIAGLLERYPKFLSGGERQRVSLARAIMTAPPLLLLDEPLSALDPQTRHAMQELLREIHHEENIGTIHVTHDFSEAAQLGNSMIVLNNGKIEQKGAPQDIFYRPATKFTAKFLREENLNPGSVVYRNGRHWFENSNGMLLGPLMECSLPEDLNTTDNHVNLFVRAGSLRLSRDVDTPASANSWTALIKNITMNRTHIDVYCNGNGQWQAVLSIAEWQNLRLFKGDMVRLSVSPDNLHIIA